MSSSSENENPSPLHSKPEFRMPSPRRRLLGPLHERPNYESNIRPGPTIRIVDDPDNTAYTKNPFPSHPSQILPPRNAPPGYAFEGRGSQGTRVSDHSSTTRVPSSETNYLTEDLIPKPLQLRKSNRASASTSNSDTETFTDGSTFTPQSTRLSQDTSPPSSPVRLSDTSIGGLGIVKEEAAPSMAVSSEAVPSRASYSTIRPVIPSGAGPSEPPLTSQTSKASFASSDSSDTLILHYSSEERSGSSSSNLPLPPGPSRQARKPVNAQPYSKKRASSAQQPPRPILKQSSESLVPSQRSSSSQERPRSSSAPISAPHVAFAARAERPTVVQYPVVRAPSATSSRAESSRTLPKKLSRMGDRFVRRPWHTPLSTISSESDRTSPSNISSVSPIRVPPAPSLASEDPIYENTALPQRSLSNLRPDNWRDSDEHHDVVAELQPPQLRPQRSGYFSRFSSDSRPSSSRDGSIRPSSSQSDLAHFISNTIPTWARYYYRRGERGGDLEASQDGESRRDSVHSGETESVNDPRFQPGVWRPRTRPRAQSSMDSLAISEGPIEHDVYIQGPPRSRFPLNEPFTPRLRHDKRSSRISAWRAPSLDEAFGVLSWSRGNRQVLLFCLGFLFPPLWMIASLLPIRPPTFDDKDATASQIATEAAIETRVGHVDEIRYQKARWWRNLNRIMSFVGVALIVAIIVLAVLASRA